MRLTIRSAVVLAALVAWTLPVAAQTRDGVMGDLLQDIEQVETKMVGLAKAMPAAAYEWRPGPGVRSTSETFMHIAADNYFIPAILGIKAPAETGVTNDYKSMAAFEKRAMTRDQVIAELEKSFAFLKASMKNVPDATLGTDIDVFGQKMTNRRMWIMATTHLHEHLGQLIAYARSNKVTPPWSK